LLLTIDRRGLQCSQDPIVGWEGVEFGQLILRKITKNVETADVRLKGYNAPKSISAEALSQTPLGELTRSPDLLAGFKGPSSKGTGGEEWKQKGRGSGR